MKLSIISRTHSKLLRWWLRRRFRRLGWPPSSLSPLSLSYPLSSKLHGLPHGLNNGLLSAERAFCSACCTTMKCAILTMDDNTGGYDSGSRYPPPNGRTPNTAVAHINAMSYSLLYILWFNNSIQNSKHARRILVNGLGSGVGLPAALLANWSTLGSLPTSLPTSLPPSLPTSLSSPPSLSSSDTVAASAATINLSYAANCRLLNRYDGLFHPCSR